jgi:hypothetical protein
VQIVHILICNLDEILKWKQGRQNVWEKLGEKKKKRKKWKYEDIDDKFCKHSFIYKHIATWKQNTILTATKKQNKYYNINHVFQVQHKQNWFHRLSTNYILHLLASYVH